MVTETPKDEPSPATKPTTPTVKTEEAAQQLEAISKTKTDPNGDPREASQSPISSKTIKSETNGTSDTLAPAQEAATVIPTAAAGASTSSTIPAVAPPPTPAPAAAPPASLTTSAAVPAAESVTPAKRSRTPEPDQGPSADKKQKTEHVPEHDIQKVDDFKAEVAASSEANTNGDGVSSWDLESMLANALGAVNDAKGAAGADDAMDIDNVASSPPLPPPRRRLEKMKFIETPTYFSRSMGLPILGSLVSWNSHSRWVPVPVLTLFPGRPDTTGALSAAI